MKPDQQIQQWCEERGVMLGSVAARLEISCTRLRDIMEGKELPTLAEAWRIELITGIRMQEWAKLISVVILLALSTACAFQHRAVSLTTSRGEVLRICPKHKTMYYFIAPTPYTSDEVQEVIQGAVAYINTLSNIPIFREARDVLDADLLITVDGNRPADASPTAVGSTTLIAPTGCLRYADIWLSALETGELDALQTIVRHELGHVLGLGHQPQSSYPDLMCAKLPAYGPLHPMGFNAEHLAALRQTYTERVWKECPKFLCL